MKAAVVQSFDDHPHYADFAEPEPAAGEVTLEVVAAGLHQLVRGRAAGQHYSADRQLPQIAGADGVARLPDGRFGWFGGVRQPWGTMAERAPVLDGSWLVLPDGADPVQVAGQLNPAMSGWMALTVRAELKPGQTVAVLGATGVSGRQAVQIARRLGAGTVIGIGRNRDALAALTDLGADQTIALNTDGELTETIGAEVDIVLDYLWGAPLLSLVRALLDQRQDPGHPLRIVQVGSMAGHTAEVPAAPFRSQNLTLVGSGLGSVPISDLMREMPRVLAEVASGRLAGSTRAVPLAQVHDAWSAPAAPSERLVFVP